MTRIEARPYAGRQRGQSTVEFVVLALVLVPLLLIVPLIGKYLDIAQTTAVASRYLAFESMVRHSSSNRRWKSDDQLAKEVRRRFFSNSDAPIKTGDTAGDFNAHRNPIWFDHRGDSLLPRFADHVGARATQASLAQPYGAWHASSFALPQSNLLTGQMRVSVADIAGLQPFDSIGLSIQRRTALLADPWAASGPASIRESIQRDSWNAIGPFPYGPLELLATLINPFVDAFERNSAPPKVGRVDPDYVPKDRIR